jgi:hypothetical protein
MRVFAINDFERNSMNTSTETSSKKLGTNQSPRKSSGQRATLTALRSIVRSAAIAVSLAFLPAVCFGQGITGSITGRVTDVSGAAVPGATVTVREVSTNSIHTVKTSDVGSYTVTQLPPGKYEVKVDSPTFQSYRQDNVTLQIDQVAEIDAQLTAGSTTETVVVTSDAPVLQTEDSSIGSVIDSQAIQNTPLNGRLGLNGLIALAPGVQAAGAQDQLATRGITVSIGTGGRNAYGGLGSTLDGVTNQEVTLQRAEPEVPSLDAIAEFKVLASGAPAQFMQPAQLIVVSASGTNKLHGEVFEFNRSKGTSAKSVFSPGVRPPYERNEYGGNLSGPIFLPHLYDGRDKSFFFAAFEGFRLTQSYFDNTMQPTLLERQGNFSEFLAGGACNSTTTSILVKNPSTGQPYAGNIINTGLNPVDTQLLTLLYPKPTAAGCGANTSEQVQELSRSTRFSLRLDHATSQKNQFRFTFLRAFYGPSPTNGTDSLQGGNSQDGEHNTNAIVGWTHTFSPSLLIDTYASYFHLPIYRTPQNVNTNFSSIIPGLGPELIQGAPQISISNITAVSESGSKDLEQVMEANTVVTKVFAKHTVKAGAGYLFDNHWNDSASSPQRGSYTFNGHYSGIAFADFLLGDPISTGQAAPSNFITRNLSSQISAFVQDDWKPLPNLTLNLGLRYDRQIFEQSPYNQNSLYIPSLKEVVVFANAYPASAIPQFLTSVPIALGPSVNLGTNVFNYLHQDKANFAPRFGFAYEAARNTVVRGAFGIYWNLLPASYVGTGPFDTLPFLSSETYTNSSGTTPTFTMNNPFSASGAFSANPGVNAEHPLVTPYTEQYNLAVEHQFGHGFDVRIGYVGQHNLKQNNYGGPGTTTPNLNIAPYPILGSSVQSNNLVQPFAAIPYVLDPIFHSNSNSLQIGAHKQYSHGIAFGAEYQWIRSLGTENIQNPSGITPNDSFGPISGITPQVLALNYSYLLPFGKGQHFLGSTNNFIDKLVSGFQFSGITTIQTGQPFSVTYSAPGTTGAVGGRASLVPGQPLYPANKTKAMWFNPAAFTAPRNAAGIAGGAYGNSGYDMLRGPRFQDWDMNLQKNIAFHDGRYRVQLRADSFNVFNHPNLGTPNASISASGTGTITAPSSTPLYEPRQIEFAGKFIF